MALLRSLLASEPPELELSIVELDRAQLSFGMILREEEHRRGGHKDITGYGGWRAYRATLGAAPPPAGRRIVAGFDLLLRARRMVTPDGEGPGCVAVSGGTIAAVEPPTASLTARRVVELADDVVLLPGLVDTHVHVNDPGRADWEGFATATAAAAAGGVTTIVDMPLNSLPPTVDPAALAVKRAAAAGRCHVDVGFWGGAIPGNGAQLGPLHDGGVLGFKCFLLPSGVDEFPPLGPAELEADLAIVASLGSQMIVHAEDPHVIERAPDPAGRAYGTFLRSRPGDAENLAIGLVLDLAARTGARVHILHLSSAGALGLIRAARAAGVRVTAETCPHYLVFSAEESRTGRPSSSAARRSGRRPTGNCCGPGWPTARSTAWCPTIRPARRT